MIRPIIDGVLMHSCSCSFFFFTFSFPPNAAWKIAPQVAVNSAILNCP